jgi:hypothetical protein
MPLRIEREGTLEKILSGRGTRKKIPSLAMRGRVRVGAAS